MTISHHRFFFLKVTWSLAWSLCSQHLQNSIKGTWNQETCSPWPKTGCRDVSCKCDLIPQSNEICPGAFPYLLLPLLSEFRMFWISFNLTMSEHVLSVTQWAHKSKELPSLTTGAYEISLHSRSIWLFFNTPYLIMIYHSEYIKLYVISQLYYVIFSIPTMYLLYPTSRTPPRFKSKMRHVRLSVEPRSLAACTTSCAASCSTPATPRRGSCHMHPAVCSRQWRSRSTLENGNICPHVQSVLS